MSLFNDLIVEPDLEWVCLDSSSVKVHQHSSGAVGGEAEAIGHSRGGRTTKIHLGVDAFGLPLNFHLSGGQVHDCKVAPRLLENLPAAESTSADKAYDSESLREQIRRQSSQPMIPRKSNSLIGNKDMDWQLYRYRHLVENAFARLKHFRAIATRYDKLQRNYQATIALACALLWLPM